MRKQVLMAAVTLAGLAAFAGCKAPEFTVDAMREHFPPRATELDMLNPLIGTWDMEGQMKPNDDKTTPLKMKASMTFQWDCDKRLLVGRMEGKVENELQMHALEVWSWDPASKSFLMTWQDGSGHIGKGHAKWDSAKREFKMSAKGKDLNSGADYVGKGVMKLVDDRTMEMTWSDYDGLGLFKMFDHTGTAKKR
ncbi:MAG: DUF1579 family protein [Phycisphaerales bacterium]|nr:DUF1579 family protein [Phycisphaerales bacterium]